MSEGLGDAGDNNTSKNPQRASEGKTDRWINECMEITLYKKLSFWLPWAESSKNTSVQHSKGILDTYPDINSTLLTAANMSPWAIQENSHLTLKLSRNQLKCYIILFLAYKKGYRSLTDRRTHPHIETRRRI